MALTRVAALAVIAAGCAPALAGDYGEPSLSTRPYPALDSALAPHAGAQVSVWAQPDRIDPTLPPPSMVSFRGALAGRRDGWLHLQLQDGDTTRIGLDYVRRVALFRPGQPRKRAAGALAGAVGLGLAAWVYTRSEQGGENDLLIVGGAAALGAGVGFLIFPGGPKIGTQIYPVVVPRGRVTTP